MVFETIIKWDLELGGECGGESMDSEEVAEMEERLPAQSPSGENSFIMDTPPLFGDITPEADYEETSCSQLSETGLLALSFEFVLDESPCASRDPEDLSYNFYESEYPCKPSSVECFNECASKSAAKKVNIEHGDLFYDDLTSLNEAIEVTGVNDQSGQTDGISTNMGNSLIPKDYLDLDTGYEEQKEPENMNSPLPKMMEVVEFILDAEGIRDFHSASKMTDEIMDEIVDNAISASEASPGSSCENSPSTGEVLHSSDSHCGKDTNRSKTKHNSIKSVVAKTKDPPTNKSSFLPPCRVCADNASGFHYGANTCEACKGFFRRSIVKIQQNKESYKCTGKGEGCVLGPGKRNPCAACRYARCLEVGMSIGAIKTGRYTYEKRTKDTVEVRKMKEAEKPSQMETYISETEVDQIIQPLMDVLLKNCPEILKVFDKQSILNRQWQIYNNYKTKVEIFGTMSVIPKDVWDEFHKETGIDLDNRQELMKELACKMERGLSIMVDFVRAIPGFSDLSVSDQTELIKASHFEFFFLMHHKMFNPELRVVSGAIGLHESEIKKLTEKDCVDMLFQFSTSLKNLDLALEEILLVRGISVTFADRCQLEDPKAVEQIQWKLLNALRVLAKRKNYRPEQRLWQILDRLTAFRTMTEMSKELDKEKCSWPVMKEHPLVLDILQS